MSHSTHYDNIYKEPQTGYSERGKTAGYPEPKRREYDTKIVSK